MSNNFRIRTYISASAPDTIIIIIINISYSYLFYSLLCNLSYIITIIYICIIHIIDYQFLCNTLLLFLLLSLVLLVLCAQVLTLLYLAMSVVRAFSFR